MANRREYVVVKGFHCGETKLEEGSEVAFEGNRVTIDGEQVTLPNLRAGINTGWLQPIGDTPGVDIVNPARSRYAESVTTHEDDMVVGSATERSGKTVVSGDFISGAEAQAALEDQGRDARVVGAVTKDVVAANIKRMKGGSDDARHDVARASLRDTRTKEELAADAALAAQKRAASQNRVKTAATPQPSNETYPSDAHWKTRVAWLKENGNARILKRIYAESTPSFQKTLQKTFPEALA